MNIEKICCFFGHRKIKLTEELENKLHTIIENLILSENVTVFYYDENYLPPRRKNSNRDVLDYQPKSGTKLAYDYAKLKRKHIINLFKVQNK